MGRYTGDVTAFGALHGPHLSSWENGTFDFDDPQIEAHVHAQLEDDEPVRLISPTLPKKRWTPTTPAMRPTCCT